MAYQPRLSGHSTHEVFNQPPPLENYNLFVQDSALVEAVRREEAGWAEESLRELGQLAGTPEAINWGFEANRYTPVLRTHDRYGHRIDEVEFHPSWHRLMETATRFGIHASPWRENRAGAHVARAAAMYLWSQVEAGHTCPISMTYAGLPVIRHQPEAARLWESRLTSLSYNPELQPAGGKTSALCGMAMTEKQGGSDVRANTTRAEPLGVSDLGREYAITGHKWFCSAPMCDVFLVLAQAPGGLSCFLLPRILPDGTRNNFFIQRLKDKLGNRSNASSEIEFDNAWAIMLGQEGRGVPTIIEMVNYTRLDCILGSASLMRQAVSQAIHHTAHRRAFGRDLIDQPLMQNVLADLALEAEAALVLAMRVARACDRAGVSEHESRFKRIGTAVGKYWITKRAPTLAAEALECLGGSGYVEESIMPRLYREAPLNSVWEGSGNVNSLDVLRAMAKEPETVEAFFAELARAADINPNFDAAVERLKQELANRDQIEIRARRVVEQMALTLQGALLLRYSPPALAEAFCVSRLGQDWGRAFGTLPVGLQLKSIVERAHPDLS
jgi:putative acyl-CoA dehydrogenase